MSFTGKPQTFLEATVSNNGFFPDLSLEYFQRTYRVPAERAQEAVELQLSLARNLVNDSLLEQQQVWEAAGHATLLAVDVAKEKDFTSYYFSAVLLRAKAELLMDFQTFSRRDNAKDLADEGDRVKQSLLAGSNKAVRRLKGVLTNITTELL